VRDYFKVWGGLGNLGVLADRWCKAKPSHSVAAGNACFLIWRASLALWGVHKAVDQGPGVGVVV